MLKLNQCCPNNSAANNDMALGGRFAKQTFQTFDKTHSNLSDKNKHDFKKNFPKAKTST